MFKRLQKWSRTVLGRISPQFLIFIFVTLFLPSSRVNGGVAGSLSGYISDAQSKRPLPGVSILIEDTELGAVSDKYGFYIINNIPAGIYSIQTRMLGYAQTRMTDVVIKTDLNTRVDFELKLEAFILRPNPQVVVTAKRYPIKKESLSSTFYIDHEQLTRKLPIDSYLDSFKLLPGIYGSHFRGGRARDVIFLLDGVPIISPLTRDVAFAVPTSAISEVLVHTGGFGTEYGNAVSGVVNIISKRGRNNFSATARAYTDYIGISSLPYDNTRRLELGFGGPMTISFGGPVVEMNYFITADINVTNTPYRQELRPFFRDPIKKNYNFTGVYDLRLSRNIRLSLQGIATRWHWRGVDEKFSFDPAALPLRENRRWRVTARLSHTASPSLFYYITASYSKLQDAVNGDTSPERPAVFLSDNPIPSQALGTTAAPWKQNSSEIIYYLDASFLKQISNRVQLKGGMSGEYYDVQMNSNRYIAQPHADNKQLYNYSRFYNNFRRFPRYLASFGEFRLEFPFLRAQIGGRLDYLNSNALSSTRPGQDSTLIAQREPGKYMFSPRLSLSIPLTTNNQITVNYGRYVRIPPFYFLYAGVGTDRKNAPLWPLYGNPDLKFVTSKSLELSYVYALSSVSTVSLTAFMRKYTDLVDTRNQLYNNNTAKAQNIPTLYQNRATTRCRGLEFELNYVFSPKSQLKFIYTYMHVTGTTNNPEDRYFQFVNYGFMPTMLDRSLNWDQQNSFIVETHFSPFTKIDFSVISRLYSPRRWLNNNLTTQQFEKIPWRNILDLKIAYRSKRKYLNVLPFVEIRNLFNSRVREDRDTFFLIHNQPIRPFEDRYGRRLRVGIQIN